MNILTKKTISLTLVFTILSVLFVPSMIFAEPANEQISSTNITLTAPIVGDEITKITQNDGYGDYDVQSSNPEVYTDTVGLRLTAYWSKGLGALADEPFYGTFEEDTYYYVLIDFEAEEGYELTDLFPNGIKVNGVSPEETSAVQANKWNRCVVKIKAVKDNTSPLKQIASKFNNSSAVQMLKTLTDYEYSAAISDDDSNILSVSIKDPEGYMSVISYELNGNILSYEHLVDENLITAYILADSIGQVNGYSDGEVFKNFDMFLEEISEYKIDNQGFEINKNNSYYSVKMDITKKVPLIDESKFYLKPRDFDMIKEFIEEGTNGNQSGKKSKFAYDLILSDDENYIYIGEKDEITENSYKSILSALEVMYGNKAVEYFKKVYPEFTDGSMILDGISIEKDYDMDFDEHPMFNGTKVTFVTVDNEYMKYISRTEYIGETVDAGNKTITLDFTKNNSFKLGIFDRIKSSDISILYKAILEPAFNDANAKLEGNTAYFNIVNGKIVAGDSNNCIFKLVLGEEEFQVLPITGVKTNASAIHEKVKLVDYKEDARAEDEFRYLQYNITVNVIYKNNPDTGKFNINNIRISKIGDYLR